MKITAAPPETTTTLRPPTTPAAGAFSQMLQAAPHYDQHAAGFGEFGMFGRFEAVISPENAASSPSPIATRALRSDDSGAVAPAQVAETPSGHNGLPRPVSVDSGLSTTPAFAPLIAPNIVGGNSMPVTSPSGQSSRRADDLTGARDRASTSPPVPVRTARTVEAVSEVALTVSAEASGLTIVVSGHLSAAHTLELRRAVDQLARNFGYGLNQFTLNGAPVNPVTVSQLGVAHGYRPR